MTGALRFVDGFGLRPHATGLDVVGGKRTVRLKGRDRQAVTLRVVDLLRAGHSPQEAAERLAVPIEVVRARVALLVRLGVLTRAPEAPAGAPPQMVHFLQRSIGADAAATALDRLARSTVHLDGDPHLCALMADQLRNSGVGTVVGTAEGQADPGLLIACGPAPAGGPDTPTLFVGLGLDEVRVGPLCGVPGGGCRHCHGRAAAPPEGVADPTTTRAGVAFAVGEAVRLLSGTGHCRTSGGVVRVHDGGRRQAFEPTARDADCPRCGLPDATATGGAAYRRLQTADVPFKMNWSHPVDPVELTGVDSRIRFITRPGQAYRPVRGETLDAIRDVLAPGPRSGRYTVPSVGGARLLNAFAFGVARAETLLWYLDRQHGCLQPIHAGRLAGHVRPSADHVVVILGAALSRAENLLGARAGLTIYQDTGFVVDALAGAGLRTPETVIAPDLPADAMHVLGLLPGRDVVTAIVRVAPGPGRPRPIRAQTGRQELIAVLAAHDGAYVRCYRVDGLGEGLYRFKEGGLRPVPADSRDIDAALAERGLDPDALVLFGTDIGHALAAPGGIEERVVEQAMAAGQVRRAARGRGLGAVLCAGLPSTALAPDGRGWRTGYRSFAAVAIAAAGVLDEADESAVRW